MGNDESISLKNDWLQVTGRSKISEAASIFSISFVHPHPAPSNPLVLNTATVELHMQ